MDNSFIVEDRAINEMVHSDYRRTHAIQMLQYLPEMLDICLGWGDSATAVRLLTERDWRPLPLEPLATGASPRQDLKLHLRFGACSPTLHNLARNDKNSTKPQSACGSNPNSAAIRRAARCMKEAGKAHGIHVPRSVANHGATHVRMVGTCVVRSLSPRLIVRGSEGDRTGRGT